MGPDRRSSAGIIIGTLILRPLKGRVYYPWVYSRNFKHARFGLGFRGLGFRG